MSLVLFAVIGFAVGYWLEMTRAGYVTLALTGIGAAVGQIVLLFATRSREAMTLWPLVIGALLALFMLVGAVARIARRARGRA